MATGVSVAGFFISGVAAAGFVILLAAESPFFMNTSASIATTNTATTTPTTHLNTLFPADCVSAICFLLTAY